MSLVKRAIQIRDRDQSVDEAWCIFDVEWPKQHPNLIEALSLAKAHNIPVALSNPAFEVWLILHLRQQNAHINTDRAVSLRRELDGSTDKHLDPSIYLPHRGLAAHRANVLAQTHSRNKSAVPHNNPSSNAFELMAAIEQGRPF